MMELAINARVSLTCFAQQLETVPMTKLGYSAFLVAFAAGIASVYAAPLRTIGEGQQVPIVKVHHEATDDMAPAQMLASLPSESWPVTDWYKQNVYDKGNNKIGEIVDLLVDHDGKNVAVLISTGGFLGIGDKTVAVPFNAVRFQKKDNNWQPVMNTTKEALQKAPGYTYDRNMKTWSAEKASTTTGGK
jgi:sporulation protein YlmC with PRC-barrel domain